MPRTFSPRLDYSTYYHVSFILALAGENKSDTVHPSRSTISPPHWSRSRRCSFQLLRAWRRAAGIALTLSRVVRYLLRIRPWRTKLETNLFRIPADSNSLLHFKLKSCSRRMLRKLQMTFKYTWPRMCSWGRYANVQKTEQMTQKVSSPAWVHPQYPNTQLIRMKSWHVKSS